MLPMRSPPNLPNEPAIPLLRLFQTLILPLVEALGKGNAHIVLLDPYAYDWLIKGAGSMLPMES